MLLSDGTIVKLLEAGVIVMSPAPADQQIQPVSVDLLLSNSWVRQVGTPREYAYYDRQTTVKPGEFLLASTRERVRLPDDLAGIVVGKSTWARRGLLVEAAGLVDPGFDGTITLELKNLSSSPIPLSAGEPICQIKFLEVDAAVLRPYGSDGLGSHYQGQLKTEPARGK